jgi:arachidonate 15-lipoxygenase (second type)/8-lipoxygenase (S-type)
LKSLDDYAKILYQNQWLKTNPLGVAPGMMTNYTQDLFFSMERLSQNPYPLQLVKPNDKLPFDVADDLSTKIAGATLQELQQKGNLFVVDRK